MTKSREVFLWHHSSIVDFLKGWERERTFVFLATAFSGGGDVVKFFC